MERVEMDAVDQADMAGTHVRRDVSRALGAQDVTIMYYEVDPGDVFSGGYHTHLDQEEIFYIQTGTATFLTEEGKREVGGGEAIRFAPGDYQHGYVEDSREETVTALAIGAPPGMADSRAIADCPGCGERTKHRVVIEEGWPATVCLECGTEGTWPIERERFMP